MVFKTVEITNQYDVTYPLDRNIYENRRIVYHGTSSIFTEEIEKNGWGLNKQPYDIDDIKFVCEAYESIDYEGSSGYAIIRSWTLGDNNFYIGKKPGYFSQNYWIARDYAIPQGGETISGLIYAINDYFDLIRNPERCFKHKEKLQKKLSRFPPGVKYHDTLLQCLKRLDDDTYFNKISEKLKDIKNKYEGLIKNHYPVVYALKVKPDWFENWSEPSKYWLEKLFDPYNDIITKEVDLVAKKSISPSCIISRINFPNGAKDFAPILNMPLPLKWKGMSRFKKFLVGHKNDPELKGFIDWYQ